MKVTVDIPEPLFRRAEALAEKQGSSLQEVIVAALAKDLGAGCGPHFDIDELGLPRLRRSDEDSSVITEDFLGRLREQEGI
ncbi:hypothetical protein [Luteolibacter sp. Populi]|uniref:hypothetical protein n=1 Tax=Luteolibacter sp. Populi TaxID=3230487 RepID=UPI0034660FBB